MRSNAAALLQTLSRSVGSRLTVNLHHSYSSLLLGIAMSVPAPGPAPHTAAAHVASKNPCSVQLHTSRSACYSDEPTQHTAEASAVDASTKPVEKARQETIAVVDGLGRMEDAGHNGSSAAISEDPQSVVAEHINLPASAVDTEGFPSGTVETLQHPAAAMEQVATAEDTLPSSVEQPYVSTADEQPAEGLADQTLDTLATVGVSTEAAAEVDVADLEAAGAPPRNDLEDAIQQGKDKSDGTATDQSDDDEFAAAGEQDAYDPRAAAATASSTVPSHQQQVVPQQRAALGNMSAGPRANTQSWNKVGFAKGVWPVYVSDVDHNLLRSDVLAYFRDCNVEDADILFDYGAGGRVRGAWVIFEHMKIRERALARQGTFLGVRKVQLTRHTKQEFEDSLYSSIASNSRGRYLVVANLPRQCNAEDVLRLFANYDLDANPVTMLDATDETEHAGKRRAIVRLASKLEATRAYTSLHNMPVFTAKIKMYLMQ